MTCKDRLKNDIVVGMRLYLDTNQMNILETVIVQVTRNLDITEQETLPATADNTNDYILNLFMARKAPKYPFKGKCRSAVRGQGNIHTYKDDREKSRA